MTDTSSRLAVTLADRYRIERELGAGGMATVYLAHNIRRMSKQRRVRYLGSLVLRSLGIRPFAAGI